MTSQRIPLRQRLIGLLHSVRLRLSLWFVVVLALILLVFSTFVYYRQTQDVSERAVARLLVRQRELYGALLADNRDHGQYNDWPPSDNTMQFSLEDQEVLLMSDPQGQLSGTWGSIDATQAAQISEKVKSIPANRKSIRAIAVKLDGRSNYLFLPTPLHYDNQLLGWMVLGQPTDSQGQLPRLALTLALGDGLYSVDCPSRRLLAGRPGPLAGENHHPYRSGDRGDRLEPPP